MRLDVPRRPRQHGLKFGERVGGAAEAQQQIGVLIKNVDIVRRERARFIEAFERLRRALECIERLAEMAPAVRHAGIGLDGGAEQPLRLAGLALLQLHRAQQIERVEILRLGFQHPRVDFFRLAQPALPLFGKRGIERLADILRRHSRLIWAIRRVTSTGVVASDAFSVRARRARPGGRGSASTSLADAAMAQGPCRRRG